MLERKREEDEGPFFEISLKPDVYQDCLDASQVLADMLHSHIEKEDVTMVLALAKDSVEIASHLGRLLNISWGIIVNDKCVPKTVFKKYKDQSHRLIDLDDKNSLLCLQHKNIILVDDCIADVSKIEMVVNEVRKNNLRKIIITAPTALVDVYNNVTTKLEKNDVTLISPQTLRNLEEAAGRYDNFVLASDHKVLEIVNDSVMNSFIKYLFLKRMEKLFNTLAKSHVMKDRAMDDDVSVMERSLNGIIIYDDLCKKTGEEYKQAKNTKKLHLLDGVEVNRLFPFQWIQKLVDVSKQPIPGFFSRRDKQIDKLSPEEEVQGFKKVLFFISCFYMLNKRIDNSKMRGKTSWFLLRFLMVVAFYNGKSVEMLTKAIKAIPYKNKLIAKAKDQFISLVDDALKMRNNKKLLKTVLEFDINMQDIIQLFVGTIKITNPKRAEELFNAKNDSYMKQADLYVAEAMNDLNVKQLRENRENSELVDTLIKSHPAVVFKAIELDRMAETFNERLKSLANMLKPKQQIVAVRDEKKVEYKSGA